MITAEPHFLLFCNAQFRESNFVDQAEVSFMGRWHFGHAILPDRWKTINPSPYAYLPFGAGPRMCIGAALGMMQLKISLPTILRRFKLTVEPGAEVNGRVMSTMLFPTSTVPMRIEPQDGRFTAHPVTGSIHRLVDLPTNAKPSKKAA